MPRRSKSTTTARRDPILKIYQRNADKKEEEEIDQQILEAIGPVPEGEKGPKRFAVILSTIVSYSFQNRPLKKDCTGSFNNERLLNSHPSLLELLVECVQEKKFSRIRDLEILKPKKDPQAVKHVRQKYGDLFTRLSITVKSFKMWKHEDILINDGHLYTSNVAINTRQDGTPGDDNAHNQPSPNDIPNDIQCIQERLCRIRTFFEEHTSPYRDWIRECYPTEFELVFGSSTDENQSQRVANDREYIWLFNINHCYVNDTVLAAKSSTSAFKSSTFCTHFIHPSLFYPFLNSEELSFKEDQTWGFPMFINVQGDAAVTKYSPRSDWGVVKSGFRLPLVISEIISQKDELDENRMLLQAIALARAGAYFMKPSSTKPFFIVAIYLSGNLEVRRYIVKPEGEDAKAKVNIVKETFNLSDRTHASIYLLEMLNLSSELEALAEDFDPDKMNKLSELQKTAQGMPSFTTTGASVTTTANEARTELLEPVSEEPEEDDELESEEEDEGEVSRFDSIEVRKVLDGHGYAVAFVDAFHPNVALIFDEAADKAVEYLKFIKEGSKELEILQYLKKIESSRNHAVRPIRSWPVEGGRMVSLPRGGLWITDLKDISKHLWDVTRQLFEGVDFLHENNVAHLDLKPHNLVIPASYGTLTIIDFGVSIRLRNPTHKMQGRVGSEGYIAPEVGQKAYNPIKADLYSCGVIVTELCLKAGPSMQRDVLLVIGSRLMDPEPNNRPMMSEILTWMDTCADSETASEFPHNSHLPSRTLISV